MSESQVPVDEDGLIRLQKLLAMSNVASHMAPARKPSGTAPSTKANSAAAASKAAAR